MTDDAAERAADLHERAIALREQAEYEPAERVCAEAVALFAQAGAGEEPNLANALAEHARILNLVDRPREAIAAAERALALLEPLVPAHVDSEPGEELVRLALAARLTLAASCRGAGHLDRAEAAARDALAMAEQHFGAGDLAAADALNEIGVISKFLGRYGEAERVYRRALPIIEAADPESPDVATLLHNLGGLAHARGDFEAGEPLSRRSVELRTASLGADHPTTAADRAAWGALLEGLGRLDEAEAAYREALAVFERRLGPDSIEVAFTLASLGSVLHSRGEHTASEAAYRRAIAIRERTLGSSHPDLAVVLHNLGMLLAESADPERQAEAAKLADRAAAMFEATLGPEHPHTKAVRRSRHSAGG